ncbi:hypothetical protein [Streptomyces sp. NPDC056227]|uniref:hypothetical protein n=1 Tax=Streptomyces sp. NPDC056227 TaxID=3345753 RepID=UPI0035D88F81
MDPGEPEEPLGRLEKLRRELARRYGEKLLAEVTTGEALRPRRDLAGVLAFVIALAVHGVTVALAVAGLLLVLLGWGSALPAVGALFLVLAGVLRPRFGRLPDEPVLHRADAPELFALIDEVAEIAGTTGVHAAVGLMDRLLVGGSARSALLREANSTQVGRPGDPACKEGWRGLWERLAAHMDSIPESEYERQRRLGTQRGHSVDSTHPPTHLRRARLLAAAPASAAVVADAGRQAGLDAELAGARERLARRILNGR